MTFVLPDGFREAFSAYLSTYNTYMDMATTRGLDEDAAHALVMLYLERSTPQAVAPDTAQMYERMTTGFARMTAAMDPEP